MKKTMLAALLCMLALTVFSAQASETPFRRYTSDYFGTVSMLCLYPEEGGEDEAEEIWRGVKALLEEIEGCVSVSRPDSDIARLNALSSGETAAVSGVTAEIWQIAMEAHELTGGLYDPTVYPLVDLWGFSPRFNSRGAAVQPWDRPETDGHPSLPPDGYVKALLPLVGMDGIALERENGRWILRKNTAPAVIAGTAVQAQADLGGIAKGYACDRVAALLREKGITEGYFVCGGSSMCFLSRPGGAAFSAAAGKPRPGENGGTDYAAFQVRNVALSTSCDAGHSYTAEDGALYCHIIDPRTGYPLNRPDERGIQAGAASVTLLGESAAMGDALSTALCLMGPRKALAFLADRDEKMMMTVYRTGAEYLEIVSNMDEEETELLDGGYIPASGRDAGGEFRYTGIFVQDGP